MGTGLSLGQPDGGRAGAVGPAADGAAGN